MIHGSCKECGMIYTATPEQRPEGHSGECDCVDCGKTVLERTGFYSFSTSEQAAMSPLRAGAQI